MTSAPRLDRNCVPNGPAPYCSTARMRRPWSSMMMVHPEMAMVAPDSVPQREDRHFVISYNHTAEFQSRGEIMNLISAPVAMRALLARKLCSPALRGLAIALAAVLAAGNAAAQAWPSKPVRIIVPFPPGNAGDVTARTLIDPLSRRLGQPIIVDNRPGAAGTIGMEAVKNSASDGYTLLITSLSPLVVNPVVMKTLPYDPIKDYQPVARIGWTG
ncbi:MAG: hypothetical protein FJY55_08600, partial [Betaproteobacteria bacterium]|nr:hypothetical protein [Betaproteobacteria bacterium]